MESKLKSIAARSFQQVTGMKLILAYQSPKAPSTGESGFQPFLIVPAYVHAGQGRPSYNSLAWVTQLKKRLAGLGQLMY